MSFVKGARRSKRGAWLLAVVALALVAVVAVLIVSGCGSSGSTAATTTGTPTAGSTVPASSVKMAVATVGSRADQSWAAAMYNGYLKLKAGYPGLTIQFNDLLAETDAVNYLTNLGQQGYNLVYIDNAFFDAVKEVAPQFPKTWFEMAFVTADQLKTLPDNVATAWGPLNEGPYLAGVAAAYATKTKKIGVVAGAAGYPEVAMATYSFFDGARSVDPTIKCTVGVTGDWVDVQKGYDTANAVIDSGADVVMQYTDNAGLGVIKACVARNVKIVGEGSDQHSLAPNNVITSFLVPHYEMQKALLDGYMAGTLSHSVITSYDLSTPVDVIAPLTNVSAEAQAKVAADEAAIKNGSLTVTKVYDPKAYAKFTGQ